MNYRTLGRSGLKVSILGMGTGGLDPLGVKSGCSEAEMVDFLRFAFDCGINLFDPSPDYGGSGRSECILGQAAREIGRDQMVISTKMALAGGMPDEPLHLMRPEDMASSLDASLRRLKTDYVDLLLMAVADVPEHFDRVIDDLLPELIKLKEQGKIRCIGSSEQTRSDGAHIWLQRVLPTDRVDVAMVGHNMINQSAQRTLFPLCQQNNIGVLNIFTVRNLFANPPRLRQVIGDLKERKVLSEDALPATDPLGWLLEDGECQSLIEAAYRYAAYTAGVTSVMCGAIARWQLEQDIAFVGKGTLSTGKLGRLRQTFGHIDEAVGN